MIKLNADDNISPHQFHGTMVRGIGRIVWARNWKGDWVRQVMHNPPVQVGPVDDPKRVEFVDGVLKRLRAPKGAR